MEMEMEERVNAKMLKLTKENKELKRRGQLYKRNGIKEKRRGMERDRTIIPKCNDKL
jgi:hypothetical protein